jgi:hypothetical protein
MTQLIKLGARFNVAESEKLLGSLEAVLPDCDLLLPTKLQAYELGGVAALIQLLITWSKRNPNGRLVTFVSNDRDAERQLEHLVTLDHGLVAVLAASDVVSRDRSHSFRARAYEFARSRIEAMEQGVDAARRGPKVLLLCADHTSKAFLPLLYFQTLSAERDVKGTNDFRILARQLLDKTAKFHPSSERLRDENTDQLGIILHELFENTHYWARTDCDGRRLKRSLRGIRFELHYGGKDQFERSAEDSPSLSTFLSHPQFYRSDEKQRLVEISLFDSGPGLAQRMLRRCLEPSDSCAIEYDQIINCLRLRSTTSGETHRGIGLHTVLTMLSEVSGFLRVRTGRLNLYRDFVRMPYRPENGTRDPFLLDWGTGTRELTECARVEGTLLTMFVPIRFREY